MHTYDADLTECFACFAKSEKSLFVRMWWGHKKKRKEKGNRAKDSISRHTVTHQISSRKNTATVQFQSIFITIYNSFALYGRNHESTSTITPQRNIIQKCTPSIRSLSRSIYHIIVSQIYISNIHKHLHRYTQISMLRANTKKVIHSCKIR